MAFSLVEIVAPPPTYAPAVIWVSRFHFLPENMGYSDAKPGGENS
jgi:hypothetical protein